MTVSTPKRRWARFGLRTLFLLVTIVAIWLGWSMNWIRQRHDFLRSGPVMALYDQDGKPTRAPGFLWLFGEEGYQAVHVGGDDNFVKEARLLFPEASVVDKYVMFKPPPWIGSTKQTEPAPEKFRHRSEGTSIE